MWRADVLAWLAVAAYALHIMEERILDWHASMKKSMKLSMDVDSYHVIGRVFLVLGAIAAFIEPTLPELARAFVVFLVLNALIFHIWPWISSQHFSPGSWTAIILFLPIAYMTFVAAGSNPAVWLWPVVIGVLVTAFPIVLMQYGRGSRR
ncbi:MAG TPA: HXXEE domain-containing protein [Xanthobacteraceae bacterium]|nr:HXXEE domain-containing protein [Xanthobacteraceae bacterium]